MKTIHVSRKSFRALTAVLLLAALSLALALPAFADVTYPTPTEYIADDAGILSESTVKYLRETNQSLISEIKSVLAVCTVKSTNGIDIGKYARAVYTEWKLPSGILLVVASDDESFFIVPSESVSQVIGNEELEEVRDQYIEEDFSAGEYDRAIRKAISKLSSIMLQELKTEEEPTANTASAGTANAASSTKTEEKSAGSVIVKILKAILIIVLVALALFVILFVIALFNDDVAALMQKYVFRRGSQPAQNRDQYYDERLYGQQQQNRAQNPQRRQNPNARAQTADGSGYGSGYAQDSYNRAQTGSQNAYNQQNRGYPQQTRNSGAQQNSQVYYNADGTVRSAQGSANRQQRPGNPQRTGYSNANAQQRVRQNPNYSQNSYDAGAGAGETRQYVIPTQNNNNR